MSIENQPAFPPGALTSPLGSRGLTKLEYFAGLAMQGLIASNDDEAGDRIDDIPGYAIDIAKALIAELEKSQ